MENYRIGRALFRTSAPEEFQYYLTNRAWGLDEQRLFYPQTPSLPFKEQFAREVASLGWARNPLEDSTIRSLVRTRDRHDRQLTMALLNSYLFETRQDAVKVHKGEPVRLYSARTRRPNGERFNEGMLMGKFICVDWPRLENAKLVFIPVIWDRDIYEQSPQELAAANATDPTAFAMACPAAKQLMNTRRLHASCLLIINWRQKRRK